MGKIHELPKSSSRLLTSSQIISSVFCVVKELVENALDGAAKNVEVKLEDYGLEKIEVKDNGCGIDKSDIPFIARPHFTSKITSYSDLEKVNTYGFRGEALGAVCAVADLIITTKTSEDSIGYTVDYSHDGQVVSTKPCPCPQGSTVSVLNLFKNIPVRRQYYRSEKNKKEDLKKIEELLIAYGCIVYDVRFALYHNKNLIWQKPALSCTKNALIHILGNSVVDHLKYSEYDDEENQWKFEIYLPSPTAPLTCGLSSSSKCITAINKRPVRIKTFDKEYIWSINLATNVDEKVYCYKNFKLIKEYYNKAIQNTGKARYPICFISFTLPLKDVDVNIEPNKTNVMLHHADEILNQFSELLKTFYNFNMSENSLATLPVESVKPNSESKQNASDFLDSLKSIENNEKFHQIKLLYNIESSVAAKKKPSDNDISVINHSSSQKRENPIVKKDVIKEPSHKKLRTSFHASKDDFQNHLTSIKEFFTQDKANSNNMPLNSVPAVTVERISSIPKTSSSDDIALDNNSNKITSYVVSINVCSESNSHVTGNPNMNRKRHFSDSSISNMKFPEHSVKQTFIDDSMKQPIINESVNFSTIHDNLKLSVIDKGIKRSLIEDNVKQTVTDNRIKQPVIDDGEAWSRGVHPSGGVFQPVKILQPKTATASEPPLTVASVKTTESKNVVPEQMNLSFGRKLTAFDIFCRNNRLEVAAQNPELNTSQIAQILCEKWNHLSSEEKAVYKNLLDKDYKQNVKKKERLAKAVSENLSQTQKKTSNKINIKIKPKLKNKVVDFCAENVKEYFENKNKDILPSDELNLINYIAPGIWICSEKKKLYLLNTFRLHETIVYRRLLETFQFESELLKKPLYITASDIGDEGMEILLKLAQVEIGRSVNIDDQRITANGFNIKVSKGLKNDVVVELIGITNSIAFYGIPDLKELFLLIKNKGYSTNLSECRPGKIMLYLQGEANRMSRQSPPCQRIQDVEDLLNKNNFLSKYKECIHHKPFFNELWNIQ